eukprot:4494884-Amphidinium_carterae.1
MHVYMAVNKSMSQHCYKTSLHASSICIPSVEARSIGQRSCRLLDPNRANNNECVNISSFSSRQQKRH